MKLLYTQTNYTRLPAFRLQTSILRSSKGLIIEKKSVSDEGLAHITELQKNQSLIQKNYPTLKLPKIIKTSKKSIQYEFIDGKNLQVELEEALFNKSYAKADDIVKKAISWISALSTTEVDRAQIDHFAKFLGFPKLDLRILGPNYNAFRPALLDLKLANLIEHGSNMYLVDTEWVYDWCVPARFVLWRTLFNTLINLQSLIMYSASHEFPSYKLSDYHQCPISWWNMFDFSLDEYRTFASWESLFQKYVTGGAFDIHTVLYSHVNVKSKFKIVDNYQTTPSQIPQILQQIESQAQQIESQAQQIELRDKIATTQAQINRLEADLNKIKSANFFKLWQGYNSLKRAFK